MGSTNRTFEAPDLIEILDEAVNYNRFLSDELFAWSAGLDAVLDFGAGNGRFAEGLHTRGRNVRALEPDPKLRAAIAARGVATVADLASVETSVLDGIYSINVLEHIDDDVGVLREMSRIVRPGGRLFLYVPAFQVLYSANDRRVGHVRRYRRAELTARVAAARFRVTRAEYVDSLGFPAALAYRVFGSRDGDLGIGAVKFYDRILFPLSRALDVVGRHVAGKNLLVEAERGGPCASSGARAAG